MNKNNFFDAQEAKDSNLLENLNHQLGWFIGLTANTRLSEIDYKATDKKGRLTHIEHKQRKGNIDQYIKYGDVLIEPSKWAATTRIMESGHSLNEQRLYINYVDDGVIIFDLNNIGSMNVYPNHKQKNYGKKTVEHEDRFGLKMSDAIIYKYNNEGKLERYRL